jgi:quercetin dioxygenase-like cupin family protein
VSDDLARRLRAQGLQPTGWANGPGERYGAHDHPYDKVIVVERGSIRFGLAGTGEAVELAPGDRLDLPAGTSHDALVGSDGVACLEAHLPTGSLVKPVRRSSGDW